MTGIIVPILFVLFIIPYLVTRLTPEVWRKGNRNILLKMRIIVAVLSWLAIVNLFSICSNFAGSSTMIRFVCLGWDFPASQILSPPAVMMQIAFILACISTWAILYRLRWGYYSCLVLLCILALFSIIAALASVHMKSLQYKTSDNAFWILIALVLYYLVKRKRELIANA